MCVWGGLGSLLPLYLGTCDRRPVMKGKVLKAPREDSSRCQQNQCLQLRQRCFRPIRDTGSRQRCHQGGPTAPRPPDVLPPAPRTVPGKWPESDGDSRGAKDWCAGGQGIQTSYGHPNTARETGRAGGPLAGLRPPAQGAGAPIKPLTTSSWTETAGRPRSGPTPGARAAEEHKHRNRRREGWKAPALVSAAASSSAGL